MLVCLWVTSYTINKVVRDAHEKYWKKGFQTIYHQKILTHMKNDKILLFIVLGSFELESTFVLPSKLTDTINMVVKDVHLKILQKKSGILSQIFD